MSRVQTHEELAEREVEEVAADRYPHRGGRARTHTPFAYNIAAAALPQSDA